MHIDIIKVHILSSNMAGVNVQKSDMATRLQNKTNNHHFKLKDRGAERNVKTTDHRSNVINPTHKAAVTHKPMDRDRKINNPQFVNANHFYQWNNFFVSPQLERTSNISISEMHLWQHL